MIDLGIFGLVLLPDLQAQGLLPPTSLRYRFYNSRESNLIIHKKLDAV